MDDRERWRELFAAWHPVTVRPMFGGFGIYRAGVMFALVADGELHLKIDALTHRDFVESGGRPFVYAGKGRPVTMSYWTAPDDVFDDPDVLARWSALAYDAALRNARGKSRRRAT
jgi:DNA transformation protein